MPLHYVAWRETMSRHGITFSEDRFYKTAGMPTDKIIEMLAAEQHREVDVSQAAHEKEVAFQQSISRLQPIEYTLDQVNWCLKSGKKVAVASGGTRESVDLQLIAIGLADIFEVRVTAEDTVRHKPEPDVFLKAAELLGLPPKDCCVYEDSDLGIQAAQAAGMRFIDIRDYHQPARVSND